MLCMKRISNPTESPHKTECVEHDIAYTFFHEKTLYAEKQNGRKTDEYC